MKSNDLQSQRLAVLIDADNTQPSIIEGLLTEIVKFGTASVKRIYGDWTGSQLKGWKEVLLLHSIQPIQQFAYTNGKNATDSAMIIDAMDLLYTDRFDAFCLVSSDSDFTRLASRIRESGLSAYGFGEKKTPKAFVNACDKFIFTEILRRKEKNETEATPRIPREPKRDEALLSILRNAVEDAADESGWAFLGTVGQYITQYSPEFDPRNYGFKKLSDLLWATESFEIDERPQSNSPAHSIYVRDIRKKNKKIMR